MGAGREGVGGRESDPFHRSAPGKRSQRNGPPPPLRAIYHATSLRSGRATQHKRRQSLGTGRTISPSWLTAVSAPCPPARDKTSIDSHLHTLTPIGSCSSMRLFGSPAHRPRRTPIGLSLVAAIRKPGCWNWPIRRQRQHGGSGDHSIVAELCGLSRRGGTRKTTLSCARTVAISLPCYSGSNATTYVVSR